MAYLRSEPTRLDSAEHLRRWNDGARKLDELDPDLVQWMTKVSRRAGVLVVVLLTCAAGIGAAVIGGLAQ